MRCYPLGILALVTLAIVALVAARPDPVWVRSEVDDRVLVRSASADLLDSGFANSLRERAENGGCLTLERKNGDQWYLGKPYPPKAYHRMAQDATYLACQWGTVMWHTHWTDTVYVVDTLGNRVGIDGTDANRCLPSYAHPTSDYPQIMHNERVVAGLIVCGPHQYMLYGEKL